jgi:hypothetical protein
MYNSEGEIMNKFMTPHQVATTISNNLTKSGISGSRSSRRTDALNDEIIKILKQYIEGQEYTFLTEKSIKCSRGDTFTVDVVVQKNGQNFLLVHLKAIESSYNKNRHNYSNTVIGETSRVFDKDVIPENLHSIWIDWIPNTVPCYNKKRELIREEKTKVPNLKNVENRWNKVLESSNSSVCYGKITFDTDNGYSNIEGVSKIEKYLESLNA